MPALQRIRPGMYGECGRPTTGCSRSPAVGQSTAGQLVVALAYLPHALTKARRSGLTVSE